MSYHQSGEMLHTVSAAHRTVSDHLKTLNVLNLYFNSQLRRPLVSKIHVYPPSRVFTQSLDFQRDAYL